MSGKSNSQSSQGASWNSPSDIFPLAVPAVTNKRLCSFSSLRYHQLPLSGADGSGKPRLPFRVSQPADPATSPSGRRVPIRMGMREDLAARPLPQDAGNRLFSPSLGSGETPEGTRAATSGRRPLRGVRRELALTDIFPIKTVSCGS